MEHIYYIIIGYPQKIHTQFQVNFRFFPVKTDDRNFIAWERKMFFSIESDVFFAFHLNKRKLCDIISLTAKNRSCVLV